MIEFPVRCYAHDFNDPDITPWSALPFPEIGETVFVMDYEWEFGVLGTVVEVIPIPDPYLGDGLIRVVPGPEYIYA